MLRSSLSHQAPASYCTALLCLRWACTCDWPGGQGLLPSEARSLTLQSLKSTLLRNDTVTSLDVQTDVAAAVSMAGDHSAASREAAKLRCQSRLSPLRRVHRNRSSGALASFCCS